MSENSMNDSRPLTRRNLTRNVLKKKSIGTLHLINIAEAIIFCALAVGIIKLIPFTDFVSNTACVVIGVAIFYFTVKGIEGRTVIAVLLSEIRYRRNRRKLHLRSPEYEKGKSTFGDSDENLSLVERYVLKIRKHLDRFIERYSTDESGQ